MVKQATYFEDSKGAAHKTAAEAWKAELTYIISRSDAVNEAAAKGVAGHLIKECEHVHEIMRFFIYSAVEEF